MTVTALPTAGRHGTVPSAHLTGLVDSRRHATSVSGIVHEATAQLLAALESAVDAALAQGSNDTGARKTAAALRDARFALDFAVTAAGRALADRDVHIPVDAGTAARGATPA
jgi:hypothetical protein